MLESERLHTAEVLWHKSGSQFAVYFVDMQVVCTVRGLVEPHRIHGIERCSRDKLKSTLKYDRKTLKKYFRSSLCADEEDSKTI